VLNQHPRAAMAHMESEEKDQVTAFYNKLNTTTDEIV
jgi:hypothetical protein